MEIDSASNTDDMTNVSAASDASSRGEAAGQSQYSNTSGGTASVATSQPAQPSAQGVPVQPQQQPLNEGQQSAATPYSQAGGKYAQGPTTPEQKHASIFHSILSTLAGPQTPAYKVDPNTGQLVAQPQPARSKTQLANSIVAGALTGLFASAGTSKMEGDLAAMGKGYNARQGQIQQQQQQAKQEATGDYVRKAAIMEANMHLALQQRELHAGQLKDWKEEKELYDNNVSNYDGLASYAEAHPDLVDPRTQGGITGEEAVKRGVNLDSIGIPIKTEMTYGPDGKPAGYHQVYIALKNEKVPIEQSDLDTLRSWDMRGYSDPRLPAGSEIRVSTIANSLHTTDMLQREKGTLDRYMDGLPKDLKAEYQANLKGADIPLDASGHIDLRALHSQRPQDIEKALQAQTRIFGENFSNNSYPWDDVSQMRANKDTAPHAGLISALYGGQVFMDKQREAIAARAAGTKSAAEETAKVNVIDSEARANAVLSNAASTTEQKKQAQDFLNRQIGFAGAKTGAEAKARQGAVSSTGKNEDGSWNPASIPVSLVDGNMDPSQLSKRSADYNLKLQQANEYSLQKYGKPFDIAKAQSDYKFSTNVQTQNTLKYLNSLTGADNKSGNLGALVNYSNQITRTSFPALNDAAAWARLQTGDPKMAAYHGAVTEVADQVAKIMQGGGTGSGTSDIKMKQAQELFNQGFSKAQILGVSNTLRTLLANRKTEMIGDNRYLQKQYGQQPQAQITVTDPRGVIHTFQSQQAADQFKQAAGIQ